MSAIWGLNLADAQIIGPDDLTALAGGAYQASIWEVETFCRGAVGLGQVARKTAAARAPSPYAASFPRHDAVVFMGRLDNRSALCETLHVGDAVASTPDQALIRLAYAQWGLACPEHLLGDWAFALWDSNQRRLLLARDATGRAPLFYYHNPTQGQFAFSSVLKGILALSGIPRRINEDYIAQHAPGIPRDAATPYKDIVKLPPGYRLVATEGKINVRQYWTVNSVPEIRLPSDRAYTEHFLEIFSEAVRCRTEGTGPIGAFLSGGLDSGAVATLAVHDLAAQGKEFQAFSAVPHFGVTGLVSLSRMGDETKLIKAVADHAGTMQVAYLSSPQTSILEGIRSAIAYTGEPLIAPGNAYWYLDILRQAHAMGIHVLLGGEGGNTTISYAGQAAERSAILREKDAWIDLALDTIGLVWQKLSRQVVLLGHLDQWRTIVPQMFKDQGSQKPSAINPDFMADYLANRNRADQQPERSTYASDQARLIDKYLRSGIFTTAWNWASDWGIEVRDPTMDQRVVEFCLGIPRDLYIHRGKSRMLIRRAMAGQMPESVLWNQRRGQQSADIVHRVLAEQAEIDDVLHRLEASALARQYLHLSSMRDVFGRLSYRADAAATLNTNAVLLRGLMIGLFLLDIEGA